MSNNIKILLSVLLGIIIGALTIRNVFNSIETANLFFELQNQLKENEYGNATINDLRAELAAYNKRLSYISKLDTSNQSRLVSVISSFSSEHAVHIHFMPAAMIDTSGAYTLETNTIQFEGDFKESLKLLYAIEQEAGLSKIVSLNFEVKEDLSNQKRKLYTTAYFQNIYLP